MLESHPAIQGFDNPDPSLSPMNLFELSTSSHENLTYFPDHKLRWADSFDLGHEGKRGATPSVCCLCVGDPFPHSQFNYECWWRSWNPGEIECGTALAVCLTQVPGSMESRFPGPFLGGFALISLDTILADRW